MMTPLTEEFVEGQPMEQPVGVCDFRMVLRNGKLERQVLVQWAGITPEKAMWEWLIDFKDTYPACNLEDKVISEGGGNVTPFTSQLSRGKRSKKTPKWQESFVMG